MQLTIVPSDSKVGVDGSFLLQLDLSGCGIPPGVHALQWIEVTGWIEFDYDIAKRVKPQNQEISALPSWANACVEVYNRSLPPPPSPPTPDEITAETINTAAGDLQAVSYLTTNEMATHITPESRQEVTDYIHAVANILATAQTKYGTGEAYSPTFPAKPTALPQLSGDSAAAPFIQFVVVN